MPTLAFSGSDQTSILQKQVTALAAAALSRRASVSLDIDDDLKISDTIEYDPALVHIRSNGRRIDASGLRKGQPFLRAHRKSRIPELSNHGRSGGFVVFGPGKDKGNTAIELIGDDAAALIRHWWQDIVCTGFQTGVTHSANCAIYGFDRCRFVDMNVCIYGAAGLTNTGENIVYRSCTMGASTEAIIKWQGATLRLEQCSLDYPVSGPHILSARDNGKGGGAVMMRGGWIEGRDLKAPMVRSEGPNTSVYLRDPEVFVNGAAMPKGCAVYAVDDNGHIELDGVQHHFAADPLDRRLAIVGPKGGSFINRNPAKVYFTQNPLIRDPNAYSFPQAKDLKRQPTVYVPLKGRVKHQDFRLEVRSSSPAAYTLKVTPISIVRDPDDPSAYNALKVMTPWTVPVPAGDGKTAVVDPTENTSRFVLPPQATHIAFKFEGIPAAATKVELSTASQFWQA